MKSSVKTPRNVNIGTRDIVEMEGTVSGTIQKVTASSTWRLGGAGTGTAPTGTAECAGTGWKRGALGKNHACIFIEMWDVVHLQKF